MCSASIFNALYNKALYRGVGMGLRDIQRKQLYKISSLEKKKKEKVGLTLFFISFLGYHDRPKW